MQQLYLTLHLYLPLPPPWFTLIAWSWPSLLGRLQWLASCSSEWHGTIVVAWFYLACILCHSGILFQIVGSFIEKKHQELLCKVLVITLRWLQLCYPSRAYNYLPGRSPWWICGNLEFPQQEHFPSQYTLSGLNARHDEGKLLRVKNIKFWIIVPSKFYYHFFLLQKARNPEKRNFKGCNTLDYWFGGMDQLCIP